LNIYLQRAKLYQSIRKNKKNHPVFSFFFVPNGNEGGGIADLSPEKSS
jgi:hypothetical protein